MQRCTLPICHTDHQCDSGTHAMFGRTVVTSAIPISTVSSKVKRLRPLLTHSAALRDKRHHKSAVSHASLQTVCRLAACLPHMLWRSAAPAFQARTCQTPGQASLATPLSLTSQIACLHHRPIQGGAGVFATPTVMMGATVFRTTLPQQQHIMRAAAAGSLGLFRLGWTLQQHCCSPRCVQQQQLTGGLWGHQATAR
jgi:hypothetical protein